LETTIKRTNGNTPIQPIAAPESAWIALFRLARLIGEKRSTGSIQSSNATLVKSLTMSDGANAAICPSRLGQRFTFPSHRKHTDMPDREPVAGS
jgi:hypothetical protein